MRQKPSSCVGCALHDHGRDFSAVEGTGTNGVLLVGEASGEMEQRDQLPFRPFAAAGGVLERCLRRMGLNRKQFAITNVVRCRPRNNWLENSPYEYAALRQCRPNLDAAIASYRPRCIVALGGVALRELTGEAGDQRGVTHLAGYVLPLGGRQEEAICGHCEISPRPDCSLCGGKVIIPGKAAGAIPVIADFHPSYLRRGKASHQGVFSRILHRALNIAAGKDRQFAWGIDPDDPATWNTPAGKLNYITHPTLDQAWSVYHYLRDNQGLVLARDIETSESTSLDEDAREGFSDTEVRLFQLSYQPGTGIAIPYVNGFKQVVQEILALPNKTYGHNWNCFSYFTSVQMGDKTWKPIWKVKAGDSVMSVDEHGALCSRIVSCLHETRDDRPWVEVRIDGAYNRGVGRWGNSGVICTPDHEWYTDDLKKKKASELKPGDRVLLPKQGSEKLIAGTLLGDATVIREGNWISVGHTNEAWSKAKAENLGVPCRDYAAHGFGKDVTMWKVGTSIPRYWRKLFYKPDGQKNWVAPEAPESLAVFYGDDGCLDSHECATFSLFFLDGPDIYKALEWFRSRYGNCSIQNEKVLRLWKASSWKFFEEISQYLHPAMEYKLPKEFQGKYNGWMAVLVPQIGIVESVKNAKVRGWKSVGRRKFCLSVEGDHRFFTRGGLVSNCFDHKVLRACAAREGWRYNPIERVYDTLDMFHHWQPDLPAHLQFCSSFINFPFPWKHLAATNIEFYGICDVDADLQLGQYLEALLKKDNLWGEGNSYSLTLGYTGQEREVRPVLAAMEDRGMPIDDAARLKLGAEFEAAQRELGVEIAMRAPEACKRVHPKEGYKGVPPEVKKHDMLAGLPLSDTRFQEPKEGEWYTYQRKIFGIEEMTPELTTIKNSVERWCRVYDFNPNSSQQLLAYMKSKGHKVPKSKIEDAEGNQKDTTAAKELQRLAVKTGDDFYLKVIEYRGLTKMRGTYVDGFRPASDGRVHTTFTFSTAIGQLSCCAPWTPVTTTKGVIPISEVKVGYLVWTHRKHWRRVTHVWVHPAEPMTELYLSNGKVLTCTTSHKLLASSYVDQQKMDDSAEYRESFGEVSQSGISNSVGPISRDEDHDSQRMCRAGDAHASSGVRGSEETSLLSLEDGQQEPLLRQEGIRESSLEGDRGRWLRVSDLLGGWQESVCSSASDGRGSGREGNSSEPGGTSHQRGYTRQPAGQSSSGDKRRSQIPALTSAHGGEVVEIKKAIPVGSFPVHDITVEEDESYESCGVFSHNSRNPNTQNFPKLKPTPALAKAMRAMVAADEGYLLTEIDFKSCHVITLGLLAGDENYTRLGRLDIHSAVAGHFLGHWNLNEIIKETDDELMRRFKWLKSDPERKRVRDDQAKHGILGIGNGLRAKGLYERYMESFPARGCPACEGLGKVAGIRGLRNCTTCKGTGKQSGLQIAEAVLSTCEALFPKVFEYQERQRQEAHANHRLTTPFGHMRRFYEVYRWDHKRNDWGHGDQAEEAVAYRLASTAHCHMREVMKDLDRNGMAERYGMFNQIHDSLMWHHRAEDAEQLLRDVIPVMTAESKVLPRLWLGVEASQGRRWSEMRTVELPTLVTA